MWQLTSKTLSQLLAASESKARGECDNLGVIPGIFVTPGEITAIRSSLRSCCTAWCHAYFDLGLHRHKGYINSRRRPRGSCKFRDESLTHNGDVQHCHVGAPGPSCHSHSRWVDVKVDCLPLDYSPTFCCFQILDFDVFSCKVLKFLWCYSWSFTFFFIRFFKLFF